MLVSYSSLCYNKVTFKSLEENAGREDMGDVKL